jgi:hypothetical protein
MRSSKAFTVVYVITSDGKDGFADMALVSMLSVRINNPGLRIVALCDADSAAALRKEKHRLLEVCDEVISIETPEGEPTFRNRWIKTQMGRDGSGSCFYVDADVVVRRRLDELATMDADVAAAPNHSNAADEVLIPPRESGIIDAMGWRRPSRLFVNGGVMWFRDTEATRSFFDRWHQLWQESLEKTGQYYDQPALNVALEECALEFQWLPSGYNAQVHARPCVAEGAAIWHIYYSDPFETPRTVLDVLVEKVREGEMPDAEFVRKLCARRWPWVPRDPLGWLAVRSMTSRRRMLQSEDWERLWLCGRRRDALRKLWHEITKAVRRPLGRLARKVGLRPPVSK